MSRSLLSAAAAVWLALYPPAIQAQSDCTAVEAAPVPVISEAQGPAVVALLQTRTPLAGGFGFDGASIEKDRIRARFIRASDGAAIPVVLSHPTLGFADAVVTRQFALWLEEEVAAADGAAVVAALARQVRDREKAWRWIWTKIDSDGKKPIGVSGRSGFDASWFLCGPEDTPACCADKLLARALRDAGRRPASEVVAWVDRARSVLPVDGKNPEPHLKMAEALTKADELLRARVEVDRARFAAERGGPRMVHRWTPEIERAAAQLKAAGAAPRAAQGTDSAPQKVAEVDLTRSAVQPSTVALGLGLLVAGAAGVVLIRRRRR